MIILVFTEMSTGKKHIFSDEEKLRNFVKKYGNEYYDHFTVFPIEDEDYTIKFLGGDEAREALADYFIIRDKR